MHHINTYTTFISIYILRFQYAIYQSFIIQLNNKEGKIFLIIKVIKKNEKLLIQKTTKLHNIIQTIFI